jgi:hypothetical protein
MPGSGVLASEGGGGSEVLAAGDLTTAFSNWLNTKGIPKNEVIRDALTTHYSVDGGSDLTTVLSRFLQNRS